jgi:hypothetical protein
MEFLHFYFYFLSLLWPPFIRTGPKTIPLFISFLSRCSGSGPYRLRIRILKMHFEVTFWQTVNSLLCAEKKYFKTVRPYTMWGKPSRVLEFMAVDSWYCKMLTNFSYFSQRLGFVGFGSICSTQVYISTVLYRTIRTTSRDFHPSSSCIDCTD